jgi:Insect cuticle protein
MKFLVVFALLIVSALAAPPPASNSDVQVLRSDFSNDPQSGYNFAFEQSDGTKRDEQGEVRGAGSENESIAVRGSFQFTGNYYEQ